MKEEKNITLLQLFPVLGQLSSFAFLLSNDGALLPTPEAYLQEPYLKKHINHPLIFKVNAHLKNEIIEKVNKFKYMAA